MDVVEKLQEFYQWADSISDYRVKDWLFVSSPIPTYTLSLVYILFSWKLGPRLMQNREPFQLKWVLVVYNVLMSVLNFHIFKELVLGSIDAGYSLQCQPVIMDNNAKQIRIASAIWWYFISKIIEFLDTVFFVLRKKSNQITFLHIYHHSTMPLIWWIGTKWVPGGQSCHAAVLNAFIHVVMYFYYGVAALGPQYQKYLWWKRYLTQMQLIQFCIALALAISTLCVECAFPRWMSWALAVYMISFLILFGNFYLQSYVRKSEGKRAMPSERNGGVSSRRDVSSANGVRYRGTGDRK